MTQPTLKTHTLGCKVNQYETELVREGFTRSGYRLASDDEAADLCVINTCTVTSEGDAKSRQVIRRMARKNPDAKLVVMGCYATRAPDELQQLPNVVEVVTDKRELPDLLGRFGVAELPEGLSQFSTRHRAYVKVQDGCLLRCSYCIIPQVRPQMSSRPLADIVAEVQRLVSHGHKEIVLTGIHLGHYGVDRNRGLPKSQWTRLSNLLSALMAIDGDFRVRLSSIEATEVTRDLIRVMAEYPQRICPHLHVCLQSGSESVLRRMKRRWGAKRFVDRCQLVLASLDRPALTTDIIVGFPGETDADFEATLDVARAVGFSKIHAFPFSARRGTPAAELAGQVPKAVKTSRMGTLRELEHELRDAYFAKLRGGTLTILTETVDEHDVVWGTSCRYAPVRLEKSGAQAGQLLQVHVGDPVDGAFAGSVIR